MNPHECERMEAILKKSVLPLRTKAAESAELRRDLWPDMLQRLLEPAVRVPWLDWALLAAVVVWLALFPAAIPVLLYHL
jgi:hypothetical protein